MDSDNARYLAIGEVLRYARAYDDLVVEVDGYTNYHYVTSRPHTDSARIMLERGINPIAVIPAIDGVRRPLIAIRSSPWKAGHETNPWHDEFDLDHGHIRYFGDHKPATVGLPGTTSGNRVILEAWQLHAATTRRERLAATPVAVFRSKSVVGVSGNLVHKGHVEFCGIAVIERLEHVVQHDGATGRSFPNIVLDLNVLSLAAEGDRIDWRWLDDRRDPALSAEETLRYSPGSWRMWIDQGRAALPRIRRRVISPRLQTSTQQMPPTGSDLDSLLWKVYRFFDGRKHVFESLAAKVAAEVIGRGGLHYQHGWLTRSVSDGGIDFVGRLDVGVSPASTPLVVLGQAKCVTPGSAITAEQVARVVARLRRGWLGVYVTTGVFSRQAQIEVIDDQYPLVLISGHTLSEAVHRLVHATYGGEVDTFLSSLSEEYAGAVTRRRPEDMLRREPGR